MKLKINVFLLFFSILAWGAPVPYSLSSFPALQALLKNQDRDFEISLTLENADSQKPILQINSTKPLIPASNLKLLTAAAAFLDLGPDFQYQTKLYTDAAMIQNNVLKGNLYLKMDGDPSLDEKKLKQLFNFLKSNFNISRIEGNLVVVPPYHLDHDYPEGILEEDKIYGYGAKISPWIVNENMFTLTINPNNHLGKPAWMNTDDPFIQVINQTQTEQQKEKCNLQFKFNAKNQLMVSGCIHQMGNADFEKIAIINPALYLYDLLGSILKEGNIAFKGDFLSGTLPQNAHLLASVSSERLSALANHMLKNSDNLYANVFLMTVAKNRLNKTNLTWEEATQSIKELLKEKSGLNLESTILKDGSGLSTENRISSKTLADLLFFIQKDFLLNSELLDGLPLAGGYGTLSRFNNPIFYQKIRAKTGTMTGVFNLSGYLSLDNGQKAIISLLLNHLNETEEEAHEKVGTILAVLMQSNPPKSITFPLKKNRELDTFEEKLRELLASETDSIIRSRNTLQINFSNSLEPVFKTAQLIQNTAITKPDSIVLSLSSTLMKGTASMEVIQKYFYSLNFFVILNPSSENQFIQLIWN